MCMLPTNTRAYIKGIQSMRAVITGWLACCVLSHLVSQSKLKRKSNLLAAAAVVAHLLDYHLHSRDKTV